MSDQLQGERRKLTARCDVILASDSAAVKMYVAIGYLYYVQCHSALSSRDWEPNRYHILYIYSVVSI